MTFAPPLQPGEQIVAQCPLSAPIRTTLTATDRRVILCTPKEMLVATPWSELEEVAHDVVRGKHRLRLWTVTEPAELMSRDEAMVEVFTAVTLGVARWNDEHGILARFGGIRVTEDVITFGEMSCPVIGATAQIMSGKQLAAIRPPDTGFASALGLRTRLLERTQMLVVAGGRLNVDLVVNPWRLDSARTFAATVTSMAGTAAPSTPPADISEQLASLAALHERGQLTDDEFSAAKARLFLS